MIRDPTDGGDDPCEGECVWLEGDINRYRVDHEKMEERQKETCAVDLKGDRETCNK
jgi:hypothetical protein